MNRMRKIKKILFSCLISCLFGQTWAENVDSCLMALPLEQRYTGEALEKFIDGFEGVETVVFTDLLKNWKNLKLTEAEQKRLTGKVEENIVQTIFLYCLQEQPTEQPVFSEVYTLVEASGIPLSDLVKHNLKFTGALQKKDLLGCISEIQYIAQVNMLGDTMQDWLVIGKVLGFVLEEADLAQSKVMLRTLDEILEKRKGQDLFSIKKIRDDFEGKIMLIEMGEE